MSTVGSGAGIETGPDRAGQALPAKRCRVSEASVAADELVAVAGDAAVAIADIDKHEPRTGLRMVGVAGGEDAAGMVQLGHDVHRGLLALLTENPFPISGERQPTRAV
jgi:hypothetical protein